MRKHSTAIILIALCWLSIQPVYSQAVNENILSCGPKNKLDGRYATLFIVRENDSLAKKTGFSIWYEMTALGWILNDSKYEIRLPLDGQKKFWVQFDPSSPNFSVSVDLEYGRSYYLKLQIMPGTNHPNPELVLLDSMKGKSIYDKLNGSANLLYYPIPLKFPEAILVGNPFNKKLLEPNYYENTDSFDFWTYRFKVPPYFQYVYISNRFVLQFAYINKLLSPTYSEFLQIKLTTVKEVKSEEELQKLLKKSLSEGKTSKKEKLVSLNYESFKALGDFGSIAISEVEDHATAVKGENDFLVLREVKAKFYIETNEKRKLIITIWLSARGTSDEMYTIEEMKERLKYFIRGWELIKDNKNGELPDDSTDN